MKVEYVDHMGDDLSVVNAARVSMDKVSDWDYNEYKMPLTRGQVYAATGISKDLSRDDTNLIKYLAKHNHWTPFAHTAITLRMSAPVPIRTQCFKHKAGFTENEESRRYISSRPEVFVPDAFRVAADNVKQGSGVSMDNSKYWKREYVNHAEMCVDLYMDMIDDQVCPEQARFILPQGCMVNWIWTGNLSSFTRFYNQRTDTHAQKEVQDLAKMVGEIVQPLFPVSWAALTGDKRE